MGEEDVVVTMEEAVTPAVTITTTTTDREGPAKMPTPIKVEELAPFLNGYEKADLIVDGFSRGFDLGYQGEAFAQATHNAKMAEENPKILEALLDKESSLG